MPYNNCKLEFRSKKCISFGISDMHKGFKYLDVESNHVYVSNDVIFNQTIYAFSTLHANADARLRSEIISLPSSLLNLGYGGEQVVDHVPYNPTKHIDHSHEDCSANQKGNG